MEKNDRYCVYRMIERYIERQQLVHDALMSLRPDFFEGIRPPNDATEQQLLAFVALTERYMNVPQRGYWGENDEWEHWIHGAGCHLTHTITGEVIGWDVSNIQTFDCYWFVDNLAWFLKYGQQDKLFQDVIECFSPYDNDNEKLQTSVFVVLEWLVEKGTLAKDGTKYKLVGPYPDE